MRNLTWMFILTTCLAVTVQADILFTFDDPALPDDSDGSGVSSYMTGVYGSPVTATDVLSGDNLSLGAILGTWNGKARDDDYLATMPGSSDLEIVFGTEPITRVSGQGYVFHNTGSVDLALRAYDSTYGNAENPSGSALVYQQTWNTGAGSQIDFSTPFTRPVSLLVFSDSLVRDIGIDNLRVEKVPLPGAVLLGLLGLGYAGRKLRKMA